MRNSLLILSFLVIYTKAVAKITLTLEQGPAWQSKNEFNISGTTGTRADLADADRGPNYSGRVEGVWQWNPHHALRVLIAPYSSKTSFRTGTSFTFLDYTYSANQILNTTYKFNSYRLSYRYTFNPDSDLRFTLGVTAKIRDANVSVSDGITYRDNPNLGFVPLVHFEVRYILNPAFDLTLIADALAAPQGRAEDILLRATYNIDNKWRVYLGYRTLEGGANNDRVYTFAWLHYAVLGLESDFDW